MYEENNLKRELEKRIMAHALEQAIKNLVKAAQIDNFGDV